MDDGNRRDGFRNIRSALRGLTTREKADYLTSHEWAFDGVSWTPPDGLLRFGSLREAFVADLTMRGLP